VQSYLDQRVRRLAARLQARNLGAAVRLPDHRRDGHGYVFLVVTVLRGVADEADLTARRDLDFDILGGHARCNARGSQPRLPP